MKKILIIQTAFLGDVILMTPVASELKRLFPECNLDVLVKEGNQSLLIGHQSIDHILEFNKKSGKWKNIYRLIKEIRSKKYDLVINLHRFGSSGIITGFSGSKLKYGYKKNPYSWLFSKRFEHRIGDGTHEVERNLTLIAEFGASSFVRPSLFPSHADLLKVEEYKTSNYIVCAPASVWFTKQLPESKWIELITQHSDKTVYLIGAPGDRPLCDSIKKNVQSNVINLAGELTLLQSAALMQDSKMNYVNDSGPLHLASAVNAPTTAFFCSTVPSFGFGPLASDSKIVEVQDLDCRPCGLHGHKQCPKGHFNCGNQINTENL